MKTLYFDPTGFRKIKKTLILIPLEFLTVFKTFLQEKEGRVLINQSNLVVDFNFKIQKKNNKIK